MTALEQVRDEIQQWPEAVQFVLALVLVVDALAWVVVLALAVNQ